MFKKILLTSILAVVSASSFAGTLSVDLYRSGNASSPKMENVRENRDVTTFQKNGVTWVKANSGGISTNSNKPAELKNWWKIKKGTSYPAKIKVYNDHTTHWRWEPAQDMPLSEYKQLLQSMNSKFEKQK